jgi:transposase
MWTQMAQKSSSPAIMTGSGKRVHKRRSKEEKRLIVEETLRAGASVSVVARRHDVNANQLFSWRQQYRRGELGNGVALVPVGVIGEGGVISAVADLAMQEPTRQSVPHPELSSAAHLPKQSKMIEVELRSGTRIRIDAGVKGVVLQQVLKLIRSLA